jgi:hypothetical protein
MNTEEMPQPSVDIVLIVPYLFHFAAVSSA